MPREMIGDSGDALLRVLADAGLQFDHDHRKRIPPYLASEKPERRLTSVGTTGWISLPGDPWSFVTPDRVIGSEKLIFQSPTYHHEGVPSKGGSLEGWQESVGWLAKNNPMLMISICVALAGPLIRHLSSAESGGIHLQGPSSIGKSTCLAAAVSVWGGRDFLRQWRATSNGLEAIAAMLTDTCLILDEINEVEPKHLGQSIYMLANGRGKTRAKQDSSARAVKTWRLTYISSGELTPAEYMRMDNTRIQAGQEMRLLNIPAAREHGAFDDLHSLSSGAELSHEIKAASAKHFGHAGLFFVERLVSLLVDQSSRLLDERLDLITDQVFKAGKTDDAQAGRAAKKFAVFALAGELATDWGIVPWTSGEATDAASEVFGLWRQDFGEGPSESRKILESVRDYIDQHGPNRFVHGRQQVGFRSERELHPVGLDRQGRQW
jgi:putative DNA primase/helicase